MVLPGTTWNEVSRNHNSSEQGKSYDEVIWWQTGRTVGIGATLGLCLRASMTPVIASMWHCSRYVLGKLMLLMINEEY